jgi:hypothetical protein
MTGDEFWEAYSELIKRLVVGLKDQHKAVTMEEIQDCILSIFTKHRGMGK